MLFAFDPLSLLAVFYLAAMWTHAAPIIVRPTRDAIETVRWSPDNDISTLEARVGSEVIDDALKGVSQVIKGIDMQSKDLLGDGSNGLALSDQVADVRRASAGVKRKSSKLSSSSEPPSKHPRAQSNHTAKIKQSTTGEQGDLTSRKGRKRTERKRRTEAVYRARIRAEEPYRIWEHSRFHWQLRRLRETYGLLKDDVIEQLRREAKMHTEDRIIRELGGEKDESGRVKSMYSSPAEREQERKALAQLAVSGPRAVLEGAHNNGLTPHEQMMGNAYAQIGVGKLPAWAVRTVPITSSARAQHVPISSRPEPSLETTAYMQPISRTPPPQSQSEAATGASLNHSAKARLPGRLSGEQPPLSAPQSPLTVAAEQRIKEQIRDLFGDSPPSSPARSP